MKITRNDKIILKSNIGKDGKGNNAYDVINTSGNMIASASDDYYIYLKNVNFRDDGTIDGRYLGTANDNLVDEQCRNVLLDENGFYVDGKRLRSARMVVVNNKLRTVVVIQS